MRPRFSLVVALLAPGAAPPPQSGSGGMLDTILLVEDRRARGEGDLALLTGALAHRDLLVVRRAARALGRLERPELSRHLLPLLDSPVPAVRSTASEAIAQAAQGFRRDSSRTARGATWPALLGALREQLQEEDDPGVRGMLALSLGRLPYVDPAELAPVRRVLIDLCSGVRTESEANTRFCRGAEALVRASWRLVALEDGEGRGLRGVLRLARAPAARRHALGALIAAQAGDDSTLGIASNDRDAELRRLALTGIRRGDAVLADHPLLPRALADSVPAVRLEALRALARFAGVLGCARINRATQDPMPAVALTAIDLLSACGGDETAVLRLTALASRGQFPAASPPARPSTWHVPAHALVALARADPGRAGPMIPRIAVHQVWQMRMYAARAAAAARDTVTLGLLSDDEVPNVREAAIAGLSATIGHHADTAYRRALGSTDFQLVLTAARALSGTPQRTAAAEALLEALDAVSRLRAETSRDTRVEILNRVREMAEASLSPRLVPYLEDFDPVVADSVSSVILSLTGERRPARPVISEEPEPVRLSEVADLRGARLVVLLEGGRQFEVALLVDEAPVTVARIARLVRQGYYEGLTFHRVAPNFVVQGGGPGANEYATGILHFMPDELSDVSHSRGTLGISTRGRDTGDGQFFVNLRDNPRLDYDYTVWGRVVSGMAVVDGMLEGARIRRIEIRPPR